MLKPRYFIFLSLICVCFLFPDESFAKDGFNYGKEWNSLDRSFRMVWMWGVGEGQDVILEELGVMEEKEKYKYRYYISHLRADAISDIMTQYYSDAANTYIPWKYMTYVAKMKLTGKSHKEIENLLELLRGYAAWLQKSK